MPGGDRTGPMGMGPMTGRSAGYCAGLGAPGYMNPGPGWGRVLGRGRGRSFGWRARGYRGGFRNPWYGPAIPEVSRYDAPWEARQVTRDEELHYLRTQAGALKEELDAITARVKDLEAATDTGDLE